MQAGAKPRIAMAPAEIAGYYANLAAGFEQLGAECALLMVVPHRFGYANKPPRSRLARFALDTARATYPSAYHGLAKARVLPVNVLSRAALVAYALRAYDVFIFSSGNTLLSLTELPLLKRLGKKVVFVFHGSDSRPPYLNGRIINQASGDLGAHLAREARRIKRMTSWVQRHADVVIDNPLSGQFHERAFVNWFRIGMPYAIEPRFAAAAAQAPLAKPGEPLRVVHAPSDPVTKGSPLIERAIERARERGLAIDFIQIEGRPNSEVLAELARCDFVIDELYSDVPGAGLAFEASALGKPTIVGGYGAAELQRWVPPDMLLPTHYCHPDELDAAIDKLGRDAAYRTGLGTRAREFVEGKCSPVAVAERILRVLQRRDVDDWLVQPGQLHYVHGTGMAEPAGRGAVRALLDAGGEQALQLADKPQLVQRLRAFAAGRPLDP